MEKHIKQTRLTGYVLPAALSAVVCTLLILLPLFSFAAGNQTTAGTATATIISKGIEVSAPYTDDDNGDNSLLIEWGLNGVNFAVGSQAVSHAVSPYNYTVGPLTNGTTYQVRVTYLDPDNADIIQTLTGLTVYNPMLHNSLSTGSSDWSGDGGWGVSGGKYGEFTCATCHVAGSSNIKQVRTSITTPDNSKGALPGDGNAITFETAANGSADFGDDSVVHATSDKICAVCHSSTKYHNDDRANNISNIHNNKTDCISCHPHNKGFSLGECSFCHGGGTSGSQGANFWPDESNSNLENDQAGRHFAHIDVLAQQVYGMSATALLDQTDHEARQIDLCGYCHATPGADSDHFDSANLPADTSFHPLWDKASADSGASFVAGNCSNIDCHNNQATGTGTYGWYDAGTTTCVMCHTAGGSNSATMANPVSGLHYLTEANTTAHDGAFGSGDAFGCESCHVKANISNHLDGVAKSTDYTGVEVGINVATMYTDDNVTTDTRGSCFGTTALGSCHSDGGNWRRLWSLDADWDIVANPDPGQFACNVCHGQTGAWNEGTSHFRSGSGATENKGSTHFGSGADECEDCHGYDTVATHNSNDSIDFSGDGVSDYVMTMGDHGTNPGWYCASCHNADKSEDATSTSSHTFPDSLAFPNSVVYAGGSNLPTGNCYACHGNGTDEYWPQLNSTDEADWPNRAGAHAEHVISIADAINGGGLYSGTTAQKNASCIYCHPSGGHTNDQLAAPADLYQDDQAGNSDADDKYIYVLDDAANPGPAGSKNFPIDTDGSFKPFNPLDPTNQAENYGTCSNIDCHSNAAYTPHWYGDVVVPGPVGSLTASTDDVTATQDVPGSVTLTWTAPGDDGDLDGKAYQYEVRYSTSPINAGNFLSATRTGEPPQVSYRGATEKMVARGLTPGLGYYFAVRTYDETYDPSEANNVSSIVAIGSAVAAHADDVEPVFHGLTHVEQTNEYSFDGNIITTAIDLSWAEAQEHSLPVTYRIWWSEYSLKTHLARGGSLPSSNTGYTETGGVPTEGGSDYTIYTDTTQAVEYRIQGLTTGVLYNLLVRASDGSPATNTETNRVVKMVLPTAMDPLDLETKMYLANGSNQLVVQADPGSPSWPGSNSVLLSPGATLTWIASSVYSVDTNVRGLSFDIFAAISGKNALDLNWQLGYTTSGGSWVKSLGNAAANSRVLGRRSQRLQKLGLFDFEDLVPAGNKLAIRLSAPGTNSTDIDLSFGTSDYKGQLNVNEQAYNHAPDAPSGINITEQATGGYLDIDWTASSDNDPSLGQTVTYDVFGSADNGGSYPYVIATGVTDPVTGVTWDTVRDGLVGSSYNIKIKVAANDGNLYETGLASPNSLASVVEGVSGTYVLDNSADTEAPEAPTIAIYETRPKQGAVFLEWLAVGDDGDKGSRANLYDVRYRKVSDGAFNWASATEAGGEPVPNFRGHQEKFDLMRLEPETDYYIAMKAADEAGNWSPQSNVITATGGRKFCGICHSTPPDDAATGGTHKEHGYTLQDCAKCHGDEVLDYTVRHYDGQLKVGWGYDASGNRLPLVTADIAGNNVSYSQNNGSKMVKIYEDTDGSGGFNPTGTLNTPVGYHTDSGSCMNFVDPTGGLDGVYLSGCHGPFTPKWADGADGAKIEPECADCHGDKSAARDLDPYGRTWDDNDAGSPTPEVQASPPVDNHGYNAGRFVGAHEKHLNLSVRYAEGDPCRLCHLETWENGLHANASPDVHFDVAAGVSEDSPATWTPNASGPGTPGTCGNLNPYSCHDTGATWTTGTDTKCNDCHGFAGLSYTVGAASSAIGHVMDGGQVRECTYCHVAGHPQSPDGITPGDSETLLIPNNPAIGINYLDGGIHIRKTIGGRATMNDGSTIDTLAEICWGCHEDNGTSEWYTNTRAMTGSSPYDYGSLDQTSWVGATWTSANFSYKTGYIQSIHTTDPTGTSEVTWDAANGRYNETADPVDKIRCSNCHDVHNRNLAPGDTMTGAPYLRGTWMGNPYEEDGAPFSQDYNTPIYSPSGAGDNRYGAVPRGGTAYNQLGGYYIDQNNVVPGTGGNATPTPATYPTSGWTLESSAGLCILCHGDDVDNLDQRAGEDLWLGTNGHSNSAIGGRLTNAANIFDFTHGRPVPVQVGDKDSRATPVDNEFDNQVPGMGYVSQQEGADDTPEGHGYRGNRDSTYNGQYVPYTEPDKQAYGFLDYDWGASVDADTTDGLYHQFSCSKCHNPHASRLPKLMITNCLDIRHNTWDDAKSSNQTRYTTAALSDVDSGKKAAYYASAQNCHRYDDSRSTQQLKGGWNKVTPWKNKNDGTNAAHP